MSDEQSLSDTFFVAFVGMAIFVVIVAIAWSLHKEAVCLTLKCPPGMTADNIRGECLCVVRPEGKP